MDDFYRAFEDRYRGSRELITSRLRAYLPFVAPLKDTDPSLQAVDLGCGRGEWLELMKDVGIVTYGVDLDEGMLAACRERGLPVERRDAIEYLQSLADESVAVVSAFHVVEHMPFTALQTLVQEALRVLSPGGLLILETPNPENLSVGACEFYGDPTHQRPLPPILLSFLPEHYGFARTKIVRLQERQGLSSTSTVCLTDVLLGVSPDYAVVAQKGAEDEFALSRLDLAFGQDYGVGLEALTTNYDRSTARLEARATAAEERLEALHSSTSWRVTAPMRWTVTSLRSAGRMPGLAVLRLKIWLKPHLVRAVTSPMSKRMIERTGRWVIAHPRLSNPIRASLQSHERLRNRLRWLILGLLPADAVAEDEHAPMRPDELTQGGRRVFEYLRQAIALRCDRP
jgi:2-polyprenyl-3-methyl-5-hydroxy-6-metoxy-1,4-benzoquinol methylase